jgi:hypothetical protein
MEKQLKIQEILDICFEEFKKLCDERHNIYVNQFYDKGITYSFHTDIVLLQGLKFLYLIPDYISQFVVKCGLKGHDLIEDGRMTFNDIKKVIYDIMINHSLDTYLSIEEIEKISLDIAEIVFQCTDYRGRNRKERKPIEYYNELVQNKLAVFVKICDIIGNVKYGLLTNSGQFSMYKKEWTTKVRSILHKGTQKHLFHTDDGSIYQNMFIYLDKIFDLE